MATKEAMACSACGTTDPEAEVKEIKVFWTAWGRNCGDFNWYRREQPKMYCEDCEDEQWRLCDLCGAAIESEYYGIGYLPSDYGGDAICPDCAPKKGYECEVPIRAPVWLKGETD